MKRNLTLTIDEALLHRARMVASRRKRSLTDLIREFLTKLGGEERAHQASVRRLKQLMRARPLSVGKRRWTRDDMHER